MRERSIQLRTSGYAGEVAAAELHGALAAVLAPQGGNAIRLTLGSPPCHRRRLEGLPPLSRRDLERHVAQCREKYFPLTDGELVTGAAWADARSRVAVAYAVDASLLRSILREAAAVRYRISSVEPEDARPGTVVLLPSEVHDARKDLEWRRSRAFAVGAGCAVFGSVLLAAAGLRGTARRALEAAPTAAAASQAAAKLQQASARIRAESIFIADRHSNQRLGQVLTGVALSLTDSTILTTLEVEGGRTRRLGFLSADSDGVLDELTRRGMLEGLSQNGAFSLVQRGDDHWVMVMLASSRPSS